MRVWFVLLWIILLACLDIDFRLYIQLESATLNCSWFQDLAVFLVIFSYSSHDFQTLFKCGSLGFIIAPGFLWNFSICANADSMSTALLPFLHGKLEGRILQWWCLIMWSLLCLLATLISLGIDTNILCNTFASYCIRCVFVLCKC